MSVRRELIVLELEDNASAEALRAAAAFQVLDSSLGKMSGSASKTRGLQGAKRDVDALGKSLDRTGSSIDTFSGRLGLLGTAAMALGPALIPIGAAAIPAIATLTAGMGAAAGAAGVMILAFQGVGDAVSAVSDYRLEPTADNLAKVREEMEKLGPAGADFVMAIDRAMPAFRDLQMTAREGMFPGLEQGLDTLVTQLPGVRDLVAGLSETVGELGAASADALVNDADWQEFFAHIGTDGASALEDFGRATGNFTAGVANLLEAMTGIGGGSAGMLETSRAFREWADNLEHTEGFKEFADYVRQSGPQVAEFLASTGKAMLAMVEAAAPWGQAVLPALTALADVTAAIAGSPLGPPLFAAAAAMLVFNKAAAASSVIMGRVAPSFDGVRTSLGQMKADLNTVASGWVLASSATERESKKYAAAQQRLRAVAGEAARTGPALAAMGLMASGASEKMGLTNTAVMALAGSMVGPWGTAAGAAVGLTMDLAAANDNLADAVEKANAAMKSGGLQELTAQAKALQATLTEATDSDVYGFDVFGAGFINAIAPLSNVEKLMGGLTGETDKAAKALEKIKAQKAGMEAIAVALGANKDSATEMASGADRAQAAMDALGISATDLAVAQKAGGAEFDILAGRIQEYVANSDSVAGRTENVGDAIANLGKDALGTAASADALAAALDGLLSPGQDLIGAQDAMASTLNNLKNNLDGTNKSLEGNSEAAIKNRAAISQGVTDINGLAAAQAAAGESSLTVAQTMNEQRQALINTGVAAGLSRQQVESLINQMGLTPDVVRTAFEAAGVEEVDAKTQRLTSRFNNLPKRLQTDIATNGIPQSEAAITQLQRKYKLTPAQVRTLALLRDNASGPIAAVIAALRAADGQSATTTITTRHVNEIITISRGQSTRPDRRLLPGQYADGGEVLGQRYPYGDKVLAMLAPGEEIITNRHGEADRFRRDRELGLIPAYAQGGTVGEIPGYASGGKIRGVAVKAGGKSGGSVKSLERQGKRLERSMKGVEKSVDRAKKRLDYWNDKRNQLKSDVKGSLKKDWFNSDASVWSGTAAGGTAAFAQQQWKQQAKDAKALAGNIKNLRKNGAGDAFIAEILRSEDPLAAARMFNKQSVGGMRHSQKLFLEATRRTQGAADSTSSIFADEQRAATRQLRAANNRLKGIEKAINRNHKQAEKTRKKTSASKAVSRGSRSRTRSKKG